MGKGTKEYYRYLAVKPRDRAWGLCVTGAGYQPSDPGSDRVPQRQHPPGHFYMWDAGRVLNEYAVVYLTHGRGEFETAQTGVVDLMPGDVLMLFPGLWHRYRAKRDEGWGVYWVHFQGETVDRLHQEGLIAVRRAVTRFGLDDALLAAFQTILDALRADTPGYAQLAGAKTMEILARVLGHDRSEQPVPRLQDIVRRARVMLEEDPCNLPMVDELIHDFDISRTHFFRVFKEQLGYSPYQYHLQMKIRRATEMLRSSHLTVKQIALSLHFTNPYHFSKLFKKKTGLSPRDYREHWQKGGSRAAKEARDRV